MAEPLPPTERGRQEYLLARQALDTVDGVYSQLTQTFDNLTDPSTILAEGNLEWFRNEARVQLAVLRTTFAALEAQHSRLRAALAEAGVVVTDAVG